ncbi:MAG: ribosome maturation factor RimM [Congregibacter sp.]
MGAADTKRDALTPQAQMLCAGRIGGAYGIKGWVRIHSFTDPIDNVLRFERWWLKRRDGYTPAVIAEGKRHGKGLVCRLESIDDRNAAETLKGSELWVDSNELPALEPGEFYWHELQGLRVWCQHDGKQILLGEVDHLLDTGANDVIVTRPCDGSCDERERLIPYVWDAVVTEVSLGDGLIRVDWHPED